MFYPPKGLCESRTQWGPFDILSFPFYCVREMVLTLSKSQLSGGLFEILKMFYSQKGIQKAEPKAVQLFLYCVLERVFDVSKSELLGGFFEILKMFYLRMGWMGRGIKSVLHCSLYFVGIQSMYNLFIYI